MWAHNSRSHHSLHLMKKYYTPFYISWQVTLTSFPPRRTPLNDLQCINMNTVGCHVLHITVWEATLSTSPARHEMQWGISTNTWKVTLQTPTIMCNLSPISNIWNVTHIFSPTKHNSHSFSQRNTAYIFSQTYHVHHLRAYTTLLVITFLLYSRNCICFLLSHVNLRKFRMSTCVSENSLCMLEIMKCVIHSNHKLYNPVSITMWTPTDKPIRL